MKKTLIFAMLLLPLLAFGQSQNFPGGITITPAGAANDLPCILGVNVLGACDSGSYTYASHMLTTPNLTVSTAAVVSGNLLATAIYQNGLPNSSTGTSNGLLAKKLNVGGVEQFEVMGSSDTTNLPYLIIAQRSGTTINGCTSSCNTGNALSQAPGSDGACTFDNTAVVGHYVVDGTSGQCHDTGSASAPSSGTWAGVAKTAGTGLQTISVEPGVAPAAGAGGPAGVTLSLTSTVATATIKFFSISGAPQTTEANAQMKAPYTGTLASLECGANTTPITTAPVVTVVVGGTEDTTDTCTVPVAAPNTCRTTLGSAGTTTAGTTALSLKFNNLSAGSLTVACHIAWAVGSTT